jgi:hypothetical protein
MATMTRVKRVVSDGAPQHATNVDLQQAWLQGITLRDSMECIDVLTAKWSGHTTCQLRSMLQPVRGPLHCAL